MPSRNRFEIGASVFAKWPGSHLYYRGSIVDYNPVENQYSLKFDNEDTIIEEIPAKNINKETLFTRSRSNSRSPSRRRSRSRSSTRKTRRQKSPSRKSPSPKKTSERNPRSPARRVSQKIVETTKTASLRIRRVSSERAAVSTENAKAHSIVVETIQSKDELDSSVTPSLKSLDNISVTSRVTRSTTRNLNDQAVENEKKVEMCIVGNPLPCAFNCFLSLVGYILKFFMPLLFVYGFHLICKNKKNCTFTKFPALPTANQLFKWKPISAVFIWYTIQAIISYLPLGKVVAGPNLGNRTKLLYRTNGLSALVISVAFFAVATYYKKVPKMFISANYLSVVTGSYLFTLLFSIKVFFCSRKAKEPSGGFLKDFVDGRTFSPRWSSYTKFDLKMFALRAGWITWTIMNLCYLAKEFANKGGKGLVDKNVSLVLLVAFQLWYSIDGLFFEETILYTSIISSDKFGYLTSVGMLVVFPFFSSLQARYLAMFPVSFRWYCYVIPIILQVVGYFIYRVSTQQKFNFRKDQHKAKLAGVDYITTSNRKNLLVDGWWKQLRHPNYLGDLLMNISWSMLCGFYHPIGWMWSVLLLPILIWMSLRDDDSCQEKYGESWREYKRRVKYHFIPYLF